MKTRRIFLTLLILVFLTTSLLAQRRHRDVDQQFEQFSLNRNLFFNFDLYNFMADSPDSSRIYFVATLVNDLLQFVKQSDSLYVAQFELSISIKTEQDSLIEMRTFHKQIQVRQFQDTNARSQVHVYYYALNLLPGKYTWILEFMDMDTKKSLKRHNSFEARNFGIEPFSYSEPVVQSAAVRPNFFPPQLLKNNKSAPDANDLKRITNHLAPFKIGNLLYYRVSEPVNFYYEIYQKGGQDSLQVSYQLINSQNERKWQKHVVLLSQGQNRFIEELPLDPNSVSPGLYVIQALIKKANIQKTTQTRLFINYSARITSSDSALANELGPLKYILPEEKYNEFKSLAASLQDSAIAQFWDERNPSPETADNPLHSEFLRRVHFANQNFFSLLENRDGWETDQGKIYILYGPPTEITHPVSPNAEYEHEVWIYHTPAINRSFIFVFKPEKGEYQLLRGE